MSKVTYEIVPEDEIEQVMESLHPRRQPDATATKAGPAESIAQQPYREYWRPADMIMRGLDYWAKIFRDIELFKRSRQ